MNLSKRSGDKELFYETLVKENTMNLSECSEDKELISGVLTKDITFIICNTSFTNSSSGFL